MFFWLASILGCDLADYSVPAVPPDTTYEDPQISQTGQQLIASLYRVPARATLPDHSRPADARPDTSFEIVMSPFEKGKRTLYRGDLPFDVGSQGRRFAPIGMTVEADGELLPYGSAGTYWRVTGRQLQIGMPKAPQNVVVRWPKLADQVERMGFATSGLDTDAFLRRNLTLDGETRDGIVLPAPGHTEYDLDIPASGAVFDTWLSLENSPILTEQSDGAVARVEVTVDGTTTEVARHALRAASTSFQHLRVKLDAFKGKRITLRLVSDPGTHALHDYVFWGSPSVWSTPEGEVRRVVVIGLDTTRPDHFGFYGSTRPTSPEVDAIANNSVVFTHAWTPAPRTRPSFRSATTGRYPLDAVGATNIGEVFQDQGFATAAFVANVHLQPRFDFHRGFEQWSFDGVRDAEEQVDLALDWMQSYQDRDTYLFLHLMDPHVFYGAPGRFKNRFVENSDVTIDNRINRWEVVNRDRRGELTDNDKAWLEDLYDGEIAYMSFQLGRFFHELDKLPGRSLVVLHSDHGEEFWEHNGYEHNHTLYDEVTRAFLVVRPGSGFEGGRRIDAPATLADIAPTLYDFIELDPAAWPEVDGRSLRPWIEGQPGDWSDRPIGVAHLRYGTERWGVVSNDHKYVLHTRDGTEELYDLGSDPSESTDISTQTDTAEYQRALALAHNMPVGPGWRIHVSAKPHAEPIRFQLPEAPMRVDRMDPERLVSNPSNQAWGEPPTRTPDEIGTVTWEEGSSEFTWTPGTNPRDGMLTVLFGSDVAVEGTTLHRGDSLLPIRSVRGTPTYMGIGEQVRFTPSVVLFPPEGEAARMRRLQQGDPMTASDDQDMLRALGYLHDEAGEAAED